MDLFLMVEMVCGVRFGWLKRVVEQTRGGREDKNERSGEGAEQEAGPQQCTDKKPTGCASWWSPPLGPMEGLHRVQRQSCHHKTPG